MIKTIFFISNISILYLIGLIAGPREPKVTHTFPTQVVAGEEYWIYIDIEKGKNAGFAKYQIDTPDGFNMEPGDVKGASFTFNDGSAKIIWMNLPSGNEMQINVKLIASADCLTGNHSFKQRFAYIEENEKKVLEVPDVVVNVSGLNVSNVHVSDTLANGNRRITRLNADHFLVEIDLYKDGIKGFAKIEELIPAGMNAEAVKKSNAVFTQLDNKIKFVWFSIPEQDSITVVYELFAETDLPQYAELMIDGNFTYLRNNETKSVVLQTPALNIVPVASITEPVVQKIEEPLVATKPLEQPKVTVEEPQEEKTKVTEPITSFSEVTSVPSPETGVTYKVQIAAGHNVVDAAYFKKRHKFDATFNIENHETWIKYTTGSYPIYKEARDKRNNVKDNYNFDGPFVTAYNDGERITVQEALMISRQKWYQ
jgi:hypothetical protein